MRAGFLIPASLLNRRQQQANEDGDDGDDDEARRPVIDESSGVLDDRSVTELDRISPGEVDVARAEIVSVGLDDPANGADEQIAVRRLKNGDAFAFQRASVLAGSEFDLAAGSEPPEVRSRSLQRERRGPFGQDVNGAPKILELDRRVAEHQPRRGS